MCTRHAAWTGGRDRTPQMDSDVYFVYLVNSVVKYRTSTVKQKATYEECLNLDGSANDNLDLVLDRRFEPNQGKHSLTSSKLVKLKVVKVVFFISYYISKLL